MNKFQREVIKRRKRALKIVGLGDLTFRHFTRLVRMKLKQDLKMGVVSYWGNSILIIWLKSKRK